MTSPETHWAALARYPSRSNAVRAVEVCVQREQAGQLTFRYKLSAEMVRVRIPPPEAQGRADGLWKHTCFEAFIAPAGANGYYELNFSPSRRWAIYRFSAYREGMSPADVITAPDLAVRQLDDRLELKAIVAVGDLDALRTARTLKLALTAVVEDDSGTLSYWALKHAPGKPDFHHPDGFVLELPP